jgi:hypothetical protein
MTLVRLPENIEKCKPFVVDFTNDSSFTFEGLELRGEKDKTKFENLLRNNGYEQEEMVVYELTGKQMNELYSLKGDVAYADDFKFIVVPGYHNVNLKFTCNAKWFDDIIQTNYYDMANKGGNE